MIKRLPPVILAGLVVAFLGMTTAFGQQNAKSFKAGNQDGKASAGLDQLAEGYGEAVAIIDGWAFVGEGRGSLESGNVSVLMRDANSGEWTKVATLEAPAPKAADRFGKVLDADGDVLIVGAPGLEMAFVFRRQDDNKWMLDGELTDDNLGSNSQFAQRSVAISGNYAVVGAGSRLNAAFVYEYVAGEWSPAVRIDSPVSGGWFGYRVGLSGNRLVSTAVLDSGQAGAFYVFDRDSVSGEWVQSDFITEPGSFQLGRKVAIEGDVIAVGEPGITHIFVRDADGKWMNSHTFGYRSGMGVSDRSVIAGDFNNGNVQVFSERPDASWAVDDNLSGNASRAFGSDTDIHGDFAIVGEPGFSFAGVGKAYIFERGVDSLWAPVSETEGAAELFGSITGGTVSCESGQASIFQCQDLDLKSFLTRQDLLASNGRMADVWGWTDSVNGHEYVLATHSGGVTFVDIHDSVNPVVVGILPIHAGSRANSWQDVKVYKDHVYHVADNAGQAGMQIFDLNQLRSAGKALPVTFEETAHYDGVGSAHNIAINEETGFAYIVGSSECGGGLHMLDINVPTEPVFVGCFSDPSTGRGGTGYSHDVQCVVYNGPDTAYQGEELCFGLNETHVLIANVTDKANPFTVGKGTYPTARYIHQGWLTEDHRYFFQGDELDEINGLTEGTTTFIWDVTDIDDPVLAGTYVSELKVIDHNLFIKGNLLYQSNYHAGLRVLDISDVTSPVEVAYFDTSPAGNSASFGGAWAAYPYFASGNIPINSMGEGLFIVKRSSTVGTAAEDDDVLPTGLGLAQSFPNPFSISTSISYSLPEATYVELTVIDVLGRTVETLVSDSVVAGTHAVEWSANGLVNGVYFYQLKVAGLVQTRSVTLAR